MCIHCRVNPSFNLRFGSGFLTLPETQLKTTKKKKKYQKQPKPRMGSRKGWHFCFLTFPITTYFNSCHYPEIPPLLPTEEHISRRDYEKLLFKGRVFLSDFQGYTHFTFNVKIHSSLPKKKNKSI